MEKETLECRNCGEPVEQTPGKKPKEFCGVSCRSSYWQKQKRAETKTAPFQERAVEQKKADPVTLPPTPRQLVRREPPPVMPAGLTPLQQQAWKAEQRKKLQEGRFK
jgi:hypothetical protein